MMNGMSQAGTGSPQIEHRHRGDVWYVKLGTTEGGGLRKIMPCIIIQIDEMNQSGVLDTALAVPLSTKYIPEGNPSEFDVIFDPEETGIRSELIKAFWPGNSGHNKKESRPNKKNIK